jgi:predicted nucleic acid-binding protein
VALERWLGQVTVAFNGRVLGIDSQVCDVWGRMCAIRSLPVIDFLLAATASRHGLTLVTRNEHEVTGIGAKVLIPF